MKKALIISYNFPPVGGAGVQRPVKFVKYLREFGWEPVVLSVANPSVPVLDPSLLKDIPDGVRVYRGRTLEPGYALKSRLSQARTGYVAAVAAAVKKSLLRLLLPDLQILWWPGLVWQLLNVLVREKPQVVFVSAPPFSSFLPAVVTARIFGRPAIIDYRDEWSFTRRNWENSVKGKMAEKVDFLLERYVLHNCSAFVAANQSYVDSIYRTYPGIPLGKGCAITNGYDQDDLGELKPVARHGGEIRITYAGTVWKATSLTTFLSALELLFQRDDSGELPQRVVVDIYGRIVDEERLSFERHKYRDVFRIHGYTQHKQIMKELLDSDILLLTLSDLPGADRIITGKAFEYMATGKHILAITPKGETSTLLTENYQNLTLVNRDDPEEVCRALSGIVARIGELRGNDGGDVTRFTRRHLTGTLCRLFDTLSENLP